MFFNKRVYYYLLRMEQRFPQFPEKKTTSRVIAKYPKISYRKLPLHLNFQNFTFQKFNNFRVRTMVSHAHVFPHFALSSVSNNFYIKKSKLEIERTSFSRVGAKLCNEIPTKLRTLPKLIFRKKICMILFNILKSENSCEDLESIISKVRKYSQ